MAQARVSARPMRRSAVLALALAAAAWLAWPAAAAADGRMVRRTDPRDPVGRHIPAEVEPAHAPNGQKIAYSHEPPTSGVFWGLPAPWGEYDWEVPQEIWVHNLAHGGVVILYRCDTPCPDLVKQLRDAYPHFPPTRWGHNKVLITPYPRLKTRLAVAAWTWIDEMEEFDRARLMRFHRAHADRGPSDVP